METKSINERVREFLAVCDEIAGLEDQLASLKASKAELQEALFELMVSEGVEHVAYQDKTVYRSVTTRASVLAGMRQQAMDALRELNLGDMIKSEPSVHSATIAAKVREWIEQDGDVPEIIKPFLSIYEDRSIRVLKR